MAAQCRSLLSTTVAIVSRRWRPSGQDGESRLALRTSGAPYPNEVVLRIMSLLASPAVTDDCVLTADRATARQLRQADLNYPGSALSSVDGSAIKRINGWREGPPLVSPPSSIRRLGLHPPVRDQCRTKKECAHPSIEGSRAHPADWPVIGDYTRVISSNAVSGQLPNSRRSGGKPPPTKA